MSNIYNSFINEIEELSKNKKLKIDELYNLANKMLINFISENKISKDEFKIILQAEKESIDTGSVISKAALIFSIISVLVADATFVLQVSGNTSNKPFLSFIIVGLLFPIMFIAYNLYSYYKSQQLILKKKLLIICLELLNDNKYE